MALNWPFLCLIGTGEYGIQKLKSTFTPWFYAVIPFRVIPFRVIIGDDDGSLPSPGFIEYYSYWHRINPVGGFTIVYHFHLLVGRDGDVQSRILGKKIPAIIAIPAFHSAKHGAKQHIPDFPNGNVNPWFSFPSRKGLSVPEISDVFSGKKPNLRIPGTFYPSPLYV